MKKTNRPSDTKKVSSNFLRLIFSKFLEENNTKSYTAKQILSKLQVDNSKDSALDALRKLAENGTLIESTGARFQWLGDSKSKKSHSSSKISEPKAPKEFKSFSQKTIFEGFVDITRAGSAYIIVEGREADIYVPSGKLMSAQNGDLVKVIVHPRNRGRRPEGEIVGIIERASEHFAGILRSESKYCVVTPDRGGLNLEILVEHKHTMDAKDGDKVVVKITRWPEKPRQLPRGIVTIVLGAIGSSDIEMKSILINNGFDLEFPPEALAESEGFPEGIDPEEIAKRRDFREITTITIDPENAKDFDDALSFKKLEDGNIEIGVHIADVSHYLKANTILDKEALKRSTSVYLVDRVCPMLPERLSNNLCSLVPHEDRYTFAAVFIFNEKFKIIDRWFGKTIIHSDRRFTYEEAQEILEGNEGDFKEEILNMNKIATYLREEKFKKGAIDFESEEVRFKLDEDGTPLSVYVKERKAAHMLIEEFMLLANKEVATYIFNKGKDQKEIPFVYRVHDTPNEEKLEDLGRFALEFGFKMDFSTPENIAKSLNNLAKQSATNDALKVLSPLAIRTMAKAEYTTHDIGHYGLAFEHYTHFTSPIRRYSDVLVHRILFENLTPKPVYFDQGLLDSQCKHISKQERKAMDAERESIKYKQVEFMEKHVGDIFKANVNGIIERGFFVEVTENKCEGLVSFDTTSEPFTLHPSKLKITGNRTGRVLKMGDSINVQLLSANLEKRQMEFKWIEE
jgi:ribonuclease R